MITAIIKGGLGNQLFQYAAANSLASHHSTGYSLDTSFFNEFKDRSFVLDKLLPIPSKLIDSKDANSPKRSLADRVIQKFKPWYKKYYIREKLSKNSSYFFQFPSECKIEGYWQNEDLIQTAIPFLKKELLKGEKMNRNCVAVHFRGGDYLQKATSEYHGNLAEGYYRKAFEHMLNQIPDAEFYLFSDTPKSFEFEFLKNFSHKWVNETDEIKAFQKLCTFQHFIIANSSFSWWPAYLNNELNGQIVAPKQWFKAKHLKEHTLALESWVKF